MLPRVTILPTVCHTYPAKIVQALWSFQLGGAFEGILVRDVKVSVCATSHTRRAYAQTLAPEQRRLIA